MSRSFLAAIRNAVVSAPEAMSSDEDEAGALAPNANARSGHEQENVMSDDPNKPGATNASGVSQADHAAAVATARTEGEQEATARFSAILTAEGVAGNAGRMNAAFQLATEAPGMSADKVVAYVVANTPAEAPKAAASAASLANRLAADPLAGADQPSADKVQAGWGKAVAQANARFGKDAA